MKKAKTSASAKSSTNDSGEKYWALDEKKRVSVSTFKGKARVDIREFYLKDNKWNPGKKGISLPLDQWRKLLDIADDVTKALESN